MFEAVALRVLREPPLIMGMGATNEKMVKAHCLPGGSAQVNGIFIQNGY